MESVSVKIPEKTIQVPYDKRVEYASDGIVDYLQDQECPQSESHYTPVKQIIESVGLDVLETYDALECARQKFTRHSTAPRLSAEQREHAANAVKFFETTGRELIRHVAYWEHVPNEDFMTVLCALASANDKAQAIADRLQRPRG